MLGHGVFKAVFYHRLGPLSWLELFRDTVPTAARRRKGEEAGTPIPH